MEEEQIRKQEHAQQVQAVLNAINNIKNNGYDIVNQLRPSFAFLHQKSLTNEEEKKILNAMVSANIKFNSRLLDLFFFYFAKESLDSDLIKQILNIIENIAEFPSTTVFEDFVDACQKSSLDTDCVKKIFKIMNAKIVFNGCGANSLLEKFLNACGKNSLDADCVKNILKKMSEGSNFVNVQFAIFLNACGENSLDGENLENLYRSGYEFLFEDFSKEGIESKLNNNVSKKLFHKLCEFHKIEKAKKQNKKLGILCGTGVTFGVLFGSGAIGLGVAVGIGALTFTIAAPIAAAVIGLALIAFGSYFVDKFRVYKVLDEIAEAKLNEKEVNVKKIPFDLSKRKEIQNALDESQKPLLQNDESER